MITVLSPAKSFYKEAFSTPYPKNIEISQPTYLKEAIRLNNKLKKYSVKKLMELMHINENIAQLNKKRYTNFSFNPDNINGQPAILAFNGEVYRGLQSTDFTKKELEFAQNHLRILSGLYGVLKPLDIIEAYRLEMGSKLAVSTYKNLYLFWGDKLTDTLNNDLKGDEILINLASNEYFKSIHTKKLKATIITPVFKDFSNGSYKVLMTYAKNARGAMARYIIKNEISTPELLKNFDGNGYAFDPSQSNDLEWVFIRG